MDILIMRHGRTAGNIEKRYNGRTDDPLCAEGVEHARRTGTDAGVHRIFISPMKRALETAGIKFPNAEHIVSDDLREMDFGEFEGKCADELRNDAEYSKWLQSGCTLPCPGGEDILSFSDRVCRAFDAIVRECIKSGEERLVIVAHGGSIMSILSRFGKPERTYYDWYVDNCGGYRARLDAAVWDTAPALTDCERFETLISCD